MRKNWSQLKKNYTDLEVEKKNWDDFKACQVKKKSESWKAAFEECETRQTSNTMFAAHIF